MRSENHDLLGRGNGANLTKERKCAGRFGNNKSDGALLVRKGKDSKARSVYYLEQLHTQC